MQINKYPRWTINKEGRFWAKIRKTDTCWIWLGYKTELGYGRYWYGKKQVMVHRLAYELCVGNIPEGLELDHLCRNTSCVRPEHLEAVTHQENMLRGNGYSGRNAQKTHCNWGHPFKGSNLHLTPDGHRVCITCESGVKIMLYESDPSEDAEYIQMWLKEHHK